MQSEKLKRLDVDDLFSSLLSINMVADNENPGAAAS